jgi:hypothetical protein
VVTRRSPNGKQSAEAALRVAVDALEQAVAAKDALRDALYLLLTAFPDLGRQFTSTEQQAALRAAYALLAECGR